METILIVDDEPKITRILDLQAKRSGYKTLIASNGQQAIDAVLKNKVSLVLMDIMMPVMNGLEALKIIKKHKPDLPVILLTAKDDTADIVEGLDEGADEYITKPFAYEEVEARIRARLRDARRMHPGPENRTGSILQNGEVRIDTEQFQVCINGAPASLSKTEYDLLHYFLSHPDKIISRDELLENVWGYSYGGSNIVDVYINYLRDKIAKHTDRKIIETVRGRGYTVKSNPAGASEEAEQLPNNKVKSEK